MPLPQLFSWFCVMPIPGKTFIEGEVVTHTDLNQAQSGLTFAEGELPGTALTDESVSRQKLADDVVNNDKVLKNSLAPDRIETAPEDVNNNRGGVILVSDSTGDFQAVHPSGDVSVASDGALAVKPSVITSDKLATNAVTRDKIGAGQVQSYHMRTLVYDSSVSAGNYVVSVPNLGDFDPVAHVGVFLTVQVNLGNIVPATLSVNGSAAYPIRTPKGDAVEATNIAGGQVLSLVFTGTAWAVMSPLTPVVRTTNYSGAAALAVIPVQPSGAPTPAKIRIRMWGVGGKFGTFYGGGTGSLDTSGAIPSLTGTQWTNVVTNQQSGFLVAGGGAGGYAEWYGSLTSASLIPSDELQLETDSAGYLLLYKRTGVGVDLMLRVAPGGVASMVPGADSRTPNSFVAAPGGSGAPTGGVGVGYLPSRTGVYSNTVGASGAFLLNGVTAWLNPDAGTPHPYAWNVVGRATSVGGVGRNGASQGASLVWPVSSSSNVPIISPAGGAMCIIETEAA